MRTPPTRLNQATVACTPIFRVSDADSLTLAPYTNAEEQRKIDRHALEDSLTRLDA